MSLRALHLACSRGERTLFSDIDFELQAGQALRVAGSNGSGKTSLLRLLCGLAQPADGAVLWQGCDIREQREEFCSRLSYLGHASGVKDDLLAWENLAISAVLSGHAVDRAQACQALAQLGLEQAAELPAGALSQGQRKRVALARLQFCTDTPLWVLDEPFTALDADAVAHLCAVLQRHLQRGGLLIYTTHQEIDLGAGRMLTLDLNQSRPC